MAVVVVLSGSAAAVVQAVVAVLPVLLQVAEGQEHLAHKLRPLVVLQVAVVLAQVLPQPLLLHLLPFRSPQVVVESEVPLHLRYQSFSAAMARSSRPTVQPTYERALSTRSLPNGRTWPSVCRNWMPVRG